MLKLFIAIAAFGVFTLTLVSQTTSDTCHEGFMNVSFNPASIEELTSRASMVVEAQVTSVYSAAYRAPTNSRNPSVKGLLYTDALLQTIRVFKGKGNIDQFVISQMGGTQGQTKQCNAEYKLVESGERYVLFLSELSPKSLADREDRGVHRFDLVHPFAGAARIENGLMLWAPGMPTAWHLQHDRKPADEFISSLIALTTTR